MWHEEGGTLGVLWGPSVSLQTLSFKGFTALRPVSHLVGTSRMASCLGRDVVPLGLTCSFLGSNTFTRGATGLNWRNSQPSCAEGLAQAPAVPPSPLLMGSAVESSCLHWGTPSIQSLAHPCCGAEAGARLGDCRGSPGLTSPQHDGNSVDCAAALQDPAQG